VLESRRSVSLFGASSTTFNMDGVSFPGRQAGITVVVHREGYAACFKRPIHNIWQYLLPLRTYSLKPTA
jgi:hypothetical protein